MLFIQFLVACHFHDKKRRQRIDHRNPDAVQATGCVIGFTAKFAACVQSGHDDFKRRLIFEFRVWVYWNAAPIVTHADRVAALNLDLDKTRMSGNSFVHRIVNYLGEQMVHGAHVGTTNIHAGATAHGLQPLQYLNIAGGIAFIAFFI